MTEDQVRQEHAGNELELSDEAIEDLEPDKEGSEAVQGGSNANPSSVAAGTGSGAGKITF